MCQNWSEEDLCEKRCCERIRMKRTGVLRLENSTVV